MIVGGFIKFCYASIGKEIQGRKLCVVLVQYLNLLHVWKRGNCPVGVEVSVSVDHVQ